MEFVDDGQIVPLALRRTHRANAGAKRKQAEEESSKAKDKQKELKKKKKRHSAPPSVVANQAKPVTKLAADFIRSSKTKAPVSKVIKYLHPHNDFYCWVCHNQRNDGNFLYCNVCPRVYHELCAKLKCPQPDWVCFECEKITDAECTETQSSAMASLTVDKLAKVLRTAIEKMKRYTNSLLFTPIDDLQEFRDYREFVYHPMDLSIIEKNVQDRCYGSTEAFLADARWIVHNAFVYFGSGNKYSTAAKSFLKACETEMAEVELCPDCYLSAVHKRDHWFAEVCSNPHPLVWAKLHGFPFWPAKAMKEVDGLIEARFFGQHDRAMVPVHNCFQYSTKIPFPASKKRLQGVNAAIREAEIYVKKLEEKLGTPYKFAPHLTPYDPNKRYTTSSLAVMPDGQVKSLTGKVLENGKESSPKREGSLNGSKVEGKNMKENMEPGKEDDKVDVDVETESVEEKESENIVEKEPEDIVKNDTENPDEEGKDGSMDSSVASSADSAEADEKDEDLPCSMESSRADGSEYPTCVQEHDHSYASPARSKSVDGQRSEEDQAASCDSEEGALSDDAENDEEVSVNSERKRKLSDTSMALPNKLSRTSSVQDDAVSGGVQESGGKEDQPGALTTNGSVNDADGTMSHGTSPTHAKNSADSQTSSSAKDTFSILPTRLPNLHDLEASVNSSNSSSNVPEDDAKSSSSTPKKDAFHLDLSKTIDTCKASLGIDEEMEEDGANRDEVEEMEDADTTGDESMESEDDDNEGPEKEDKQSSSTSSKGPDDQDMREVGQPTGGGLKVEEDGSKALITKTTEEQGSDLDGMETEDYGSDGQNYKMTRIQALVKDETTEEETGDEEREAKAKTGDKRVSDSSTSLTETSEMEDESPIPAKAEIQNVPQSLQSNDKAAETKSKKDGEDQTDDDEDDDVECLDDYDDDSSDGALLIDEGDDESKNSENKKDQRCGKVENGTSTIDGTTTLASGAAISTPTDPVDRKEQITPGKQLQLDEKVALGEGEKDSMKAKDSNEAKAEKTSELESKEVKAEKTSGLESKKVADLSKASDELVQGVPKASKENEDYQKLIAKVVDDAVKSFKELDASLGDVSEDFKKLVLDLKREVISLKAKQDLQQKELMHCNKLAAAEIRQVMEYNRDHQLANIKRKYDTEKGDAIFATKAKQWCASCLQEANYFCCWNTSYCSYSCQERHWTKHEKTCQQKSGNFPFLPGPDYVKKKKKKKKKEIDRAWLKEYNLVDDESDDGDPTWEPDPEDLPTRVPQQKSYSSSPHYVAQRQKPKIMNPPLSQTRNLQAPNRSWTQPGSTNIPSKGRPSASQLEARQRFQAALTNASANTQQIYYPGSSAQQNRIAGAQSTVLVKAPTSHQNPVQFLAGSKGTMPASTPNVVYVGAPQPGMQTSIPQGQMLAAMGVGNGVPAPGAVNNMPLRLQVAPDKVSSLVQALGQPMQQGNKYVIQLAPGQQLAQLPQLPNQNQPAPVVIQTAGPGNSRMNRVQNLYPVGPKKIVTLAPNAAPQKPVIVGAPQKPVKVGAPNITNTPASPAVIPATSIAMSTLTIPAAPTQQIPDPKAPQSSSNTPAMDTS